MFGDIPPNAQLPYDNPRGDGGVFMRFMVIEKFDPANARRIYERVEELGRSLPEDLAYVDSWVSDEVDRCFQLMECDDRSLIDVWTRSWEGLATF